MPVPRNGAVGLTMEQRLAREAEQAARVEERRQQAAASVEFVMDRVHAEIAALESRMNANIVLMAEETTKSLELVGNSAATRDTAIRELRSIAFYIDSDGDICSVRSGVREKIGHVRGPQGPQGEPGASIAGPPGPQGERGAKGDVGALPIATAWQPATVYYTGDVVAHGGSLWQAKIDNEREPSDDAKAWVCLAAAGKDARSLIFRGAYRLSERYARSDVVMLGGSSFIARQDDPGECPNEHWALLAGVGRRGARGPQGERGRDGAKGERGSDAAPSPLIVEWKFVPDTYTVIAVMDDGRVSAPLDLRAVFEKYNSERGS
jgi:hypothetical protein